MVPETFVTLFFQTMKFLIISLATDIFTQDQAIQVVRFLSKTKDKTLSISTETGRQVD